MNNNQSVRKERIRKIKDTTYEVLSSLGKIALMGTNIFITPAMMWREAFDPFADEKRAENERMQELIDRRKYLYQLKRAKLIKERKTAKGLEYALTAKGVEALLRENIVRENKILENQYCIVSFDIPESQKHVRKMLRSFLMEANFFLIHKSVWATDKDVANQLIQLVKCAKVEKWVNVFIANPLIMNSKNKPINPK